MSTLLIIFLNIGFADFLSHIQGFFLVSFTCSSVCLNSFTFLVLSCFSDISSNSHLLQSWTSEWFCSFWGDIMLSLFMYFVFLYWFCVSRETLASISFKGFFFFWVFIPRKYNSGAQQSVYYLHLTTRRVFWVVQRALANTVCGWGKGPEWHTSWVWWGGMLEPASMFTVHVSLCHGKPADLNELTLEWVVASALHPPSTKQHCMDNIIILCCKQRNSLCNLDQNYSVNDKQRHKQIDCTVCLINKFSGKLTLLVLLIEEISPF